MAIDISSKQIYAAHKNIFGFLYPKSNDTIINKIIIKILQSLYPFYVFLINFKKSILLLFVSNKNQNITLNDIKLKIPNEYSYMLKEKGWCFIEDFLDHTSYKSILKYWPNKNNFKLNPKVIKNFSLAFVSIKKSTPKNLENHKYLKHFYEFLNSSNFDHIVTNFLGGKSNEFTCYSIVSSILGKKNYLAPHRDGIASSKNKEKIFNFIYFIDGNNTIPEFSGGTGMYEDNNFERPIFITKNLKNTCLIYNSTDKFYHGYKIMAREGYRKAIAFQVFPKKII
jgi:hypothetical protein